MERRRRDCENAFENADDYALNAQVVLQQRAASGRVQSEMWTWLVRRPLSETMKNCELPETMLRVEMEKQAKREQISSVHGSDHSSGAALEPRMSIVTAT